MGISFRTSQCIKFIFVVVVLLSANNGYAHSPMFTDTYQFNDSNEGESTYRALQFQKSLMLSQAERVLTPCENNQAAGFPCANIDLQAFMGNSQLGGGASQLSDVWGWTDLQTGQEIAIVAKTNGTSFVDITEPTTPTLLGFLPSNGGGAEAWRDVKIYNSHAFIVADGATNASHGLQIFDLTRLRSLPSAGNNITATAHFSGFGYAHNIAINEETGFAYVTGSNRCSGGLYMLDITRPQTPVFEGCFSLDGYTHDAQCVVYNGPDSQFQGREICLAFNEDSLTIVDVSNKANPTMISRSEYTGSQYTHQGWFLDNQHTHVLLNDELDETFNNANTRTHIFDVTSLSQPRQLSFYEFTNPAVDHNLYTKDNLVFESNYRSGLRILRVDDANTSDLVEVGYFDTIPGSDAPEFSGAWSSYIYFNSGNIVTSDIGNGLYILKPDYEALATQSAFIPTPTTPPTSSPRAVSSSPPVNAPSSSGGGGGGALNIGFLLVLLLLQRLNYSRNAQNRTSPNKRQHV